MLTTCLKASVIDANRYFDCSGSCNLLPFPCRFAFPFAALGLHPGPFWTLGVRLLWVPPLLYVPAMSYPSYPPHFGIVRFCCLCRVVFLENVRGQGASTPWKSRALVLTPFYLAMSASFGLPRSPSPLSLSPLLS